MNNQYKPSEMIKQKLVEKYGGRNFKRKLRKNRKSMNFLDDLYKSCNDSGRNFDSDIYEMRKNAREIKYNKIANSIYWAIGLGGFLFSAGGTLTIPIILRESSKENKAKIKQLIPEQYSIKRARKANTLYHAVVK